MSISLLWPGGARPDIGTPPRLPADAAADLQVAEVIRALAVGEGRPARRDLRERLVRAVLTDLCMDPAVIAYRQEVIEEILADLALRERIATILPDLESLAEVSPSGRFQVPDEAAVQRVARQLGDLELFVEVVRSLERALTAAPLRSAALTALRDHVLGIVSDAAFLALETELPALRATLSQARSVTVGINLSPDLQPESATILSLSEEPVEGTRTLLGRLLGGLDVNRGITPLQRVGPTGAGPVGGFGGQPNRLMRDLNKLLEDVVSPVGRAIDRYTAIPIATLAGLGPEFALLLNGALLVERLGRAGLPMCRPEIAPTDERITAISEGYDISFALRVQKTDAVVANDMAFDDASARVWILTGPNGAGKTTFTRAVGLAQVLFQAGLYVPGRRARLSPVDAIYTHFPSQEQAQPGMGRLDEEAERLAGIFKRATPSSLVLLNETLAGTAASEAEAIARDALRGLRLLGARAIYVTHLHDLALTVDEINATTPGTSLVGSLVADADDEATDNYSASGPQHRRTFRIHPGLPRGRSYASDIARRYGISFPQLSSLLRERGITSGALPDETGSDRAV